MLSIFIIKMPLQKISQLKKIKNQGYTIVIKKYELELTCKNKHTFTIHINDITKWIKFCLCDSCIKTTISEKISIELHMKIYNRFRLIINDYRYTMNLNSKFNLPLISIYKYTREIENYMDKYLHKRIRYEDKLIYNYNSDFYFYEISSERKFMDNHLKKLNIYNKKLLNIYDLGDITYRLTKTVKNITCMFDRLASLSYILYYHKYPQTYLYWQYIINKKEHKEKNIESLRQQISSTFKNIDSDTVDQLCKISNEGHNPFQKGNIENDNICLCCSDIEDTNYEYCEMNTIRQSINEYFELIDDTENIDSIPACYEDGHKFGPSLKINKINIEFKKEGKIFTFNLKHIKQIINTFQIFRTILSKRLDILNMNINDI